MSEAVQSALTGGAVALLLVYAVLHLRGPRGAEVVLGLLFASGAAYMTAVWARTAGPRGLAEMAAVVAAPGPWLFLAAAWAYFEDRVWRRRTLLAGAAAMCALGAGALTHIPVLHRGFDVAAAGLFLAALVMAARGWRDDLVAERRRDRAWFLGAGAVLGLAITALSALRPALAAPFAALAVLAALLAYGVRYLRVETPLAEAEPIPPSAARPTPPDPRIEGLAQRIRLAFETDRLHRHEDLSLSRLARHLDAPEHHVRSAINRGLGARNFNAFVNGYRLREAAEALASSADAETPITTIALDAGFASLPTFNRVFRAAYGEAPGAFRRRALSSTART